ncbi:hypothetical protein [Kitasatospora sp. A2-31]|uniref:hypothetical protein n=1 Tax=Kitasatospora sp. A2-31 TaxID=2916414 RepID=UPI001EEEE34C|nr:hypothetical protein [Kitasatospora sp. A2-31]MCG6499222.1 hypothetical protein [Kitasatospora sp. A2-31]
MTTIDVLNKAGHSGEPYVAPLRAALVRVGPRVTALTGLPLPPMVRLRLLSVPDSVTATSVSLQRALREAAPTVAGATDELVGRLHRQATDATRDVETALWPRTLGKVIYGPADTPPEIVVTPASYDEARVTEPLMYVTLANKLVQLAAVALRPSLLADAARINLLAVLRRQTPIDQPRPLHVVEGYARLVSETIAADLTGAPSLERRPGDPQPSGAFRVAEQLRELAPYSHATALAEQAKPFVEAVLQAGGPELIKRVLLDDLMWPTSADLAAPAEWISRHVAGGGAR